MVRSPFRYKTCGVTRTGVQLSYAQRRSHYMNNCCKYPPAFCHEDSGTQITVSVLGGRSSVQAQKPGDPFRVVFQSSQPSTNPLCAGPNVKSELVVLKPLPNHGPRLVKNLLLGPPQKEGSEHFVQPLDDQQLLLQ